MMFQRADPSFRRKAPGAPAARAAAVNSNGPLKSPASFNADARPMRAGVAAALPLTGAGAEVLLAPVFAAAGAAFGLLLVGAAAWLLLAGVFAFVFGFMSVAFCD